MPGFFIEWPILRMTRNHDEVMVGFSAGLP
jgi:hypothetical protein